MDNVSEKIYRASLKFLVPLSAVETYPLVVSEAMKLVKADCGSILLKQDGILQRIYASDSSFFKMKIEKDDPVYSVLKNKQPLIFTREKAIKIHPEIKSTKVHSGMISPLIYKNKAIGILTLMSSQEQAFKEDAVHLISVFSTLASLAIRKAQLHDETQGALEARDLFISMAAHELHTPLTTINGYIQLLYDRLSNTNTREGEWIKELSTEGHRLVKLVKEFLQLERIKTGKLHYLWKEFSLAEIIRRAELSFRFMHPEYQLVFHNFLKGHPELVIGDPDKLTQVVINILNNAAKYSSPATFITIYLQFVEPNSLVIKIRDLGKGIAKKDLPNIFKRYYRGSNPQREGIGLGLFLAQNIIMQHRGKIQIRSREGKGTTVIIRLPVANSSY